MKMFKQAIVKTPCKRLSDGISDAGLGKPDYRKAIVQHAYYVRALEACGLKVTVLEPDERFPDSTFVEDTAVLTERCAVICCPGVPGRKGEETAIVEQLKIFYPNPEYIEFPGTLEGGDVMPADNHFYIGLSGRTNRSGAEQFIQILDRFGYTGSVLPLKNVLHLKTGVSYIENNHLLAAGEFIDQPAFKNFEIIAIDDEEQYAANSIWVNDRVLLPMGFEKTRSAIEEAGYQTLVVDVSEYRKLDGGLSCLSLRF